MVVVQVVGIELYHRQAGGSGTPYIGVDGVAHVEDLGGPDAQGIDGGGEDGGVGLGDADCARVDHRGERGKRAISHLADAMVEQAVSREPDRDD